MKVLLLIVVIAWIIALVLPVVLKAIHAKKKGDSDEDSSKKAS